MKTSFLVFSFFLLSSCKTQEWTEQTDISDSYKISAAKPFVQYRLYHFSNDSSTLFIHFQNPEENISLVPFILKFQYFDNNNSSQIADSGRFLFSVIEGLSYSCHLAIKGQSKGILKLEIKYQSVFPKNNQFLPVDKFNHSNQFFTYEPATNSTPDYVIGSDAVKVSYVDATVNKLWVHYYFRTSNPARAAFMAAEETNFSFAADSVFQMENNGSFTPIGQGLYKITVEQKDLFGLTLLSFYDGYPMVNTINLMVESLRYIARNKEYDSMQNENKIKMRLDSFWLKRSSFDLESSQKLIKIYYNRVQHCNMLFTSNEEGWKTDRGMMYIVYGEPDKVFYYDNYENWIYNSTGDMAQLSFIFKHKENPFTLNEFDLERHTDYLDSWRIASFRWRSGIVAQ